jgi:hypothetical protein
MASFVTTLIDGASRKQTSLEVYPVVFWGTGVVAY